MMLTEITHFSVTIEHLAIPTKQKKQKKKRVLIMLVDQFTEFIFTKK